MNLSIFASSRSHTHTYERSLSPYLSDYSALLQEQGYNRHVAAWKIRLIADCSRWLTRRRRQPADLNSDLLARYLRHRHKRRLPRSEDQVTLHRFLEWLRCKGVCRPEAPLVPKDTRQREEEAFRHYLAEERGLSSSTLVNYLPFIHNFLAERFDQGPIRFARLCAEDITGHVRRQAATLGEGRKKLLVTALRSFLRYLRHRGVITTNLAACVPAVASWNLSNLPKFIAPEQIQKVLDRCHRSTPQGRRNYAILLLLARLGLRAGEIVKLTLDDLHWDTGELTIQGKGGRVAQMPMPQDVGRAIAAYLKKDRPVCSTRRVFIRMKAPLQGFADSAAITTIVERALRRAKVAAPRRGAHLFRHSLATSMLRHGGSLRDIGHLLRHQRLETTAIYAKVDLSALRTLARPWLGGVR
jgi:site-specific recombinase XerD